MPLTNKEIEKLHDDAKTRVHVSCDENHAHSAIQGCLGGDEQAISICKLAEALRHDRRRIRDVVKEWEK